MTGTKLDKDNYGLAVVDAVASLFDGGIPCHKCGRSMHRRRDPEGETMYIYWCPVCDGDRDRAHHAGDISA